MTPELPDDELAPARGGSSRLVALLGFTALIVVAVGFIVALVSLGRMLDRWI